jgi:hypothetical protein
VSQGVEPVEIPDDGDEGVSSKYSWGKEQSDDEDFEPSAAPRSSSRGKRHREEDDASPRKEPVEKPSHFEDSDAEESRSEQDDAVPSQISGTSKRARKTNKLAKAEREKKNAGTRISFFLFSFIHFLFFSSFVMNYFLKNLHFYFYTPENFFFKITCVYTIEMSSHLHPLLFVHATMLCFVEEATKAMTKLVEDWKKRAYKGVFKVKVDKLSAQKMILRQEQLTQTM